MRSHDRDDAEFTFLKARSKAIDTYSSVEQSLCSITSAVLNTNPELTGIVFFKITSARARNSVVEALIKKRFGPTYNLFWNSLLKFIGGLDQRRNEIVHWRVIHHLDSADGAISHELSLAPPNVWGFSPSTRN